jgi:hypothetical protein
MRKQRLYTPLLLLLTMVAHGQTGGLSTADGKTTASCVGSPLLAELSKSAGTEILKPYGYDFHEPWSCTKIESPWAAGANLLRFQKVSAQSDEATAFSVHQSERKRLHLGYPDRDGYAGGSACIRPDVCGQ